MRGRNAEPFDLCDIGADGNEVRGPAVADPVQHPRPRPLGIGLGFHGREGFGNDHDQSLGGIEPVERAPERSAVDIAADPDVERPWLAVTECVHRQNRPQLRAADADGDGGTERLARSRRDPAVQHPGDEGLQFFIRCPARGKAGGIAFCAARGGMQGGPALAVVDDVAGRHTLQERGDPGLCGERFKRGQHLRRGGLA